jgi:hypothetical protein
MASALHLSTAAANAAADAVTALLDGGTLKIYAGTQPATANTAISTQTLLATCTFANPAFGAASGGIATANSITADSDCAASGTATWFRALTSGGAAVLDGSCGASDADCLLSSTTIVQHSSVTITAMTITQALT